MSKQEEKRSTPTAEKLETGLKIGAIAMNTILGIFQIYFVVRNGKEPVNT